MLQINRYEEKILGHTDILNITTVPFLLIQAPGVGKYIDVISMNILYFNATDYENPETNGGIFLNNFYGIYYNANAAPIASKPAVTGISVGTFTSTSANGLSVLGKAQPQSFYVFSKDDFENLPLYLWKDGDPLTGGSEENKYLVQIMFFIRKTGF